METYFHKESEEYGSSEQSREGRSELWTGITTIIIDEENGLVLIRSLSTKKIKELGLDKCDKHLNGPLLEKRANRIEENEVTLQKRCSSL